jgi:hypothetical protein
MTVTLQNRSLRIPDIASFIRCSWPVAAVRKCIRKADIGGSSEHVRQWRQWPKSRPPVSHHERQVYGGKQAIRRRTSVLGFTSAYQLEDLGDWASATADLGPLAKLGLQGVGNPPFSRTSR